MTKADYKHFARKALSSNGLDGWTIKFNGRIKRAVGKCKPRKKRIDLAKTYFVDHESAIDEEQLKDVILHEVAHALDFERRGTSDHSRKWKRVAREVGANPSRTTKLPEEIKKAVADWKRECPKCGWTALYHSKPTAKGKICPDCHESWHPREEKLEYVLDIKRNR